MTADVFVPWQKVLYTNAVEVAKSSMEMIDSCATEVNV